MPETILPADRPSRTKMTFARIGPIAIMAALGLLTLAWSVFVIGEAIAFVVALSP